MPTEWSTRRHEKDEPLRRGSVRRPAAAGAPARAGSQWRRSRRAGLLLVVVYVVLWLIPVGSAFDQSLRGDPAGTGFWFTAATDLLAYLTPLAVGAVTVAVALVVWRHRGRWAAAQTVVVTVLAPAVAEVLKAVLPTWSHDQADQLVWGGSFPSGHVAVTTALVLGAWSLSSAASPGRARMLRTSALVLPAVVAVATVVAGWHEPADTVGGALLALAVHHAVSAVRIRRGH